MNATYPCLSAQSDQQSNPFFPSAMQAVHHKILHSRYQDTIMQPSNPSHSKDDDVELALLITPSSSKLPTPDDGDNDNADDPVKETKAPNWRSGNNFNAISTCTLYSACSVSMILVNKSLASRYVALHPYCSCCSSCSRIVVRYRIPTIPKLIDC